MVYLKFFLTENMLKSCASYFFSKKKILLLDVYLKEYICKHLVGKGIILKEVKPPTSAKSIPIRQKRKLKLAQFKIEAFI
ncbi:hypothetical protein BpHYR1_036680 [Brachionus plicatilis]|uniref:Uncharacterized protein n=1 Tax=Brachionus plicatilis TaxID=10195 RepID=A0A3M7QLA9_BRAPC|nr:hypothetical protein BpHYR1_036680 [Brachionus plicatilis]